MYPFMDILIHGLVLYVVGFREICEKI